MRRRHALLLATLVLAGFTGGAVAQTADPPPDFIVFFSDWSGALDDAATGVIGQAADKAKAAPDQKLVVTGYTDSKGSPAANKLLAELRAQRVIDGLLADGVPQASLVRRAKGPQKGKGVVNRRVEIVFTAPASK